LKRLGSARVPRAISGVPPENPVRRDAEHHTRGTCSARQTVAAPALQPDDFIIGHPRVALCAEGLEVPLPEKQFRFDLTQRECRSSRSVGAVAQESDLARAFRPIWPQDMMIGCFERSACHLFHPRKRWEGPLTLKHEVLQSALLHSGATFLLLKLQEFGLCRKYKV
jgi:hypothetical protein